MMKLEDVQDAKAIGINLKGKFGQYLCKHENKKYFTQQTGSFSNIQGETHYLYCVDCGKYINNYFAKYEGNGYK